MTKTRTVILAIAGLIAGPGCSNTLTDYVAGARPDVPMAPMAPVIAPRGPMRIAVGPGAVDATAGPLRFRAAVHRNGALVDMGGDRRARFTLNQSHAEQ